MKHYLKTFVKLTACTAIALYTVNKWIELHASFAQILKSNTGKCFNWKHGKIFYQKCGSGSPLLLLHDLQPTSSSQEWEKVIDQFAKNHTVYAVDLLGCGRSEKPNMVYTNFLYVQFLSDFTTEVIKDKTDVVATGRSAAFAITAANYAPNLFGKLYLVNPPSLFAQKVCPNIRSKTAKALLRCPILGSTVYYLSTSREQIEYDFAEKYFYNPFQFGSKLVQAYYDSAHLLGSKGRFLAASIQGNYMNFDLTYALSKVKSPILLLFGEKMENMQKIGQSYQKINPTVQVSVLKKTKMLPQLEAPKKFSDII